MLDEIPNGYKCYCEYCGSEFSSFYYSGGVIEHQNQTSDWNLSACERRGDFEEHYLESNAKAQKHIELWVKEHKLNPGKLLPTIPERKEIK